MSRPDLDEFKARVHAALRTAIRAELGEGVFDRHQLLVCYTSVKRILTSTPSPDGTVISDIGYRAMLSAEFEAICMQLYNEARDY